MYGPGEIIFNKNDRDNRVYFLVKGNVELFLEEYEIYNPDYRKSVIVNDL